MNVLKYIGLGSEFLIVTYMSCKHGILHEGCLIMKIVKNKIFDERTPSNE